MVWINEIKSEEVLVFGVVFLFLFIDIFDIIVNVEGDLLIIMGGFFFLYLVFKVENNFEVGVFGYGVFGFIWDWGVNLKDYYLRKEE